MGDKPVEQPEEGWASISYTEKGSPVASGVGVEDSVQHGASGMEGRDKRARQVCGEIMTTERFYVRCLNMINDHYVDALKNGCFEGM